MFRSDILNIQKVRIGSNMQCFEFFGQPSVNEQDQRYLEIVCIQNKTIVPKEALVRVDRKL